MKSKPRTRYEEWHPSEVLGVFEAGFDIERREVRYGVSVVVHMGVARDVVRIARLVELATVNEKTDWKGTQLNGSKTSESNAYRFIGYFKM